MDVRAFTLLLLWSGTGAAAAAPSSSDPGACPAPASRIDEAHRKFHPGHYAAIGRAQLVRNRGFSTSLGQGLTGIQIRYRWAELEPEEGRYDFSAVTRDLAQISRAGLQMVVLIEDKSFKNELPTPSYLQGKYTRANRQKGYTAVRWDAHVQDRFDHLIAELGPRFDCDPHFEGISFEEMAPSFDDSDLKDTGYTPEKYRDAQIRMLRSAAAAVPRSRVFWSMNFLPGNQEYIADIAAAVAGSGVVMGGPDILPDNPALRNRVYPFYNKFKGRLKLFNSMEHNSYRHRRAGGPAGGSPYWSMEDLFTYARDQLHVDYIFWDYQTWRKPPDSHDWSDAQGVFARHPAFSASPKVDMAGAR